MAAAGLLVILLQAQSTTTLRVCAGSSCAGRCVGAFEPVRAFRAHAEAPCSRADVEVETVLCMNMCKRGPNVRLLHDGQVATVPAEMGETERSRYAFQAVRDDDRVWKAAAALSKLELACEAVVALFEVHPIYQRTAYTYSADEHALRLRAPRGSGSSLR